VDWGLKLPQGRLELPEMQGETGIALHPSQAVEVEKWK
jgi:hypothetical protein